MSESNDLARVEELERQLADLKARLPAHSIPPSMMMALDELEERLEKIRERKRRQNPDE